MILLEKRIKYKPGGIIKIKPIFDVHFGSKFCDVTEFKTFLRDAFTENTYFIGGGDLLDSIIVKDAKRYRKSGDDMEGDDIIDQQIDKMVDMLMPYKEKIIGLCSGNHEDTITKRCSTNPMKRICKALDVPFLGFSCLVRLILEKEGGGGIRTLVIREHHGWGGGSRTRGANITKYERDIGKWDADIFLYGHVHQKQYDRVPRLGIGGQRGAVKLMSRPTIMCICGTYLKTFSETADPTYSEAKGFPPAEIGGITIKIKPTNLSYKLWAEL